MSAKVIPKEKTFKVPFMMALDLEGMERIRERYIEGSLFTLEDLLASKHFVSTLNSSILDLPEH